MHAARLMMRQRSAFSILELVVILSILTLALALAMPAIQRSREAARKAACLNHLRQIAQATQVLISSHDRLPRNAFNADPRSHFYRSDQGWLMEILPFLHPALADKYDRTTTAFDSINESVYSSMISLFHCPSNSNLLALTPTGKKFGSGELSRGHAATADYQGVAGFHDISIPSSRRRGAIQTDIPGVSAGDARLSNVTDGLSNTLLSWESTSSHAFHRTRRGLVQKSWQDTYGGDPPTIAFLPNLDHSLVLKPLHQADTLSYFRGWAGFSAAMLFFYDSVGESRGSNFLYPHIFPRATNTTNHLGQPFSFHGRCINVAMLDGSVRTICDDVDARLFANLCSIAGDSP